MMLRVIKLVLPGVIPSWNFFDVIAPSPRIEYAALSHAADSAREWRRLRPKPQHVSAQQIFRRLFFNRRLNESLFLTSCAERILENPTSHSIDEIFTRLDRELDAPMGARFLQFRLVILHRVGDELQSDVAYVSPIRERARR